MPAYKVTWTQQAIATAIVDVELDELARWAISAGVVRAGPEPRPAEVEALRRSLERNTHLRDAVLRVYATRQQPGRE
ncbi:MULTISPECIES: hypothetical protein [Microbacterium]|uniref:hypothetical protein n=1 Tax=Microbacterium TaxID=33882 RepID=UPI0008F47E38|nr:hypothetical protein [Microbacterium sp. LCT-H2]OIJ29374.1 hypothetical protein BK819_15815 [Microbacterium sp. LCT-H2]